MARIQLRDTTIYIRDGLSGTGLVEDGNSAFAVPEVNTTVEGVNPGVDEVQVLAQYIRAPSGGTYTLTFDDGVEAPLTTGPIAFGDDAAAIQIIVDTGMATYLSSSYTPGDITVTDSGAAGISDGTVTLTFDATIDSLSTVGLKSLVLNSTNTTLVPVGARFTIATETDTPIHTVTARDNSTDDALTLRVAFTPALISAVADAEAIEWLPQRIAIKIGEGDLSWTEAREIIYDRDRSLLDSTRLGDEQPVEVDLAFIFDFVATESGQAITPIDALKRTGEASEWVSSSSDLCEPYAIDIYVVHCVPCGSEQDQDFTFADFRYESLEYSIQDASIAVSGSCNVSNVPSTRSDLSVEGC
jgi:hypothetical protein